MWLAPTGGWPAPTARPTCRSVHTTSVTTSQSRSGAFARRWTCRCSTTALRWCDNGAARGGHLLAVRLSHSLTKTLSDRGPCAPTWREDKCQMLRDEKKHAMLHTDVGDSHGSLVSNGGLGRHEGEVDGRPHVQPA